MRNNIAWIVLAALTLSGCGDKTAGTSGATIGVAFETLQTEYWVASRDGIAAELKKRKLFMLEAIADGDANRQFEQVRNFITRRVDGIIVVPKDAQTVVPMIREANRAGIPIVLFNRPPAKSDARSVTVVADNFSIAKDTVAYLAEQALKIPGKHQAAILIGDLGDMNAIARRDGFEEALKPHAGRVEIVSRIPTEWNQEKALAGITNALQAHPAIDVIFVSSDLLLPSVVSALKSRGRYHKAGEPGHVVLGGFDGDATAYRMLTEGYLDATGVQDVGFDTAATVQAVIDLRAGKAVPETLLDPGFVIHQGNLRQEAPRMWGAAIRK
ncbi:MAG: sugar ABC transporter substrate-binding protein [Candidatus Solibacter sp.]|nr:sugar ABC transporter substrate-binding protein [Candidatus Solibacter sp.]